MTKANPTQAPEPYLPRLIAWEVTRSCPLACKHCRAAARPTPYAGEFTTDEGRRLLDHIASFARPTMILTGGEPMLRTDIYDLAEYAHRLGLPVVMAPCGQFVDDASVERMKRAGLHCISISIDGATAATHDAFRGVPGAFEMAIAATEAARRGGLDFQINTTVTQHNLAELAAILELSVRLGASAFNPFLLVPTGRGRELAGQEISPEAYEQTLRWLADQEERTDIQIRVTCAPHYTRILREKQVAPGHEHAGRPAAGGKGCLGGKAFAFISHVGKVQICGFLETECGDLRREGLDFRKIWETSEVFRQMRNVDAYHGKCGLCEYRRICGGCRARAFAMTDDYLAAEPFCIYQPRGKR
jgi:heme b synthase